MSEFFERVVTTETVPTNSILEWHDPRVLMPSESGEYIVMKIYGDLTSMSYSVKHQMFNTSDNNNDEVANHNNLNHSISLWAKIDSKNAEEFVKERRDQYFDE